MPNSDVHIEGTIVNELNIRGSASIPVSVSGTLTNSIDASGSLSIPDTLDRTAIHYDTKEHWDAKRSLIAKKSHIYVYSNHTTVTNSYGEDILCPGIKIGDGTSYLIDLPFAISDINPEVLDHISDTVVHVSLEDRSRWDNKVFVDVDLENEELIFST